MVTIDTIQISKLTTPEGTKERCSGPFRKSWVNGPTSGLPFNDQRAFELKHLRDFCKNKNPGDLSFSALLELSRPRYRKDKHGNPDPIREKALVKVYTKAREWKHPTIKRVKDELLKELESIGKLPYKAPPRLLSVAEAEDKIDRFLNQMRLAFLGEDRAYIKSHIIKEVENW